MLVREVMSKFLADISVPLQSSDLTVVLDLLKFDATRKEFALSLGEYANKVMFVVNELMFTFPLGQESV
jgi:hypothetical protein